jgi:hypothetical protein
MPRGLDAILFVLLLAGNALALPIWWWLFATPVLRLWQAYGRLRMARYGQWRFSDVHPRESHNLKPHLPVAPHLRYLAGRSISRLDDVTSEPVAAALATRLAAPTRQRHPVQAELSCISQAPLCHHSGSSRACTFFCST